MSEQAAVVVSAVEAPAGTLARADGQGFFLREVVSGKEVFRRLKARTAAPAEMEARKALQEWKVKLRNLWLRGGVWYVVARVHGRRISRSLELGESDLDLARTKARGILAAARERRWEVLEQTSLRQTGYATLGECCRVFDAAAVAHGLRPGTVRDYRSSLARVLGVDDLEKVSCEALSREAVRKYVAGRLAVVDSDGSRRTMVSTVRQARAMFGEGWAVEAYRDAGLKLPELREWREAFVVQSDQVRYRLPDRALIAATEEAAVELREKRPELWAVWLLVRYLALRAGEAAAARWDWLVEDTDGRWYVEIVNRPEFRCKGSEGKVPVPGRVVAWLNELRAKAVDGYVLPGGNKTARMRLIEDEFSAWMRGLGWKTGKCAHEMRKLRGSEWYTKRGLEAACAWLRHADPSTTKRFYADFTVQPPTLEVGE